MSWLEAYARDFSEISATDIGGETLIVRDLDGVAIQLSAESQWAFYRGVLTGIQIGERRNREGGQRG